MLSSHWLPLVISREISNEEQVCDAMLTIYYQNTHLYDQLFQHETIQSMYFALQYPLPIEGKCSWSIPAVHAKGGGTGGMCPLMKK